MTHPPPIPHPLPLVGRRAELGALRLALDDAVDGRGQLAMLRGESGVGKSRIVAELIAEARTRQVTVLASRAFAIERDRPYGVWSDALNPWVVDAGPAALARVCRGLERDLAAILPAIPLGGRHDAVEDKGRLFWNFTQFVSRLAQRQPLLIALEDLHDADPASLELLHFAGRHIEGARALLLGTWVTGTDQAGTLDRIVHSLGDRAVVRTLAPLTTPDVRELLQRAFGFSPAEQTALAERLQLRSVGNPYFVEELLKAMVARGVLHHTAGTWRIAGPVDDGVLPASIRESVTRRLDALSAEGRRVAEVVALAGTHASVDVLASATGLDAMALATALDQLTTRDILLGEGRPGAPFTFSHHVVQATLEAAIPHARARAVHHDISQALVKSGQGASVDLARHYSLAGLGGSREALPHLLAAGREALTRHADAEAVRWLRDASQILHTSDHAILSDQDRATFHADMAKALQRTGEHESAQRHREQALRLAGGRHNPALCARILRDAATAAVALGRSEEGVATFRQAMDAAREAGALHLETAARVAAAMTLQSLGRSHEGKALLEEALPEIEGSREPRVIANAHRALVMLYGWTGPASTARRHAAIALEAARAARDDDVAWSVHWALAVLEGFTGNAEGVQHHRQEAQRIADASGSPLRQAITAEIAIEYASATGAWDEAERWSGIAIPVARAVAPRTLLPRLLVWTGLVLLARDQPERAAAMIDEAWELSGAGLPGSVPPSSVQNVILAHTGRAALHLLRSEWSDARRLGEAGLALADRHGLVVRGIHRLLPQVAEAAIWQQDFGRAVEVAERLRRDGEPLGHRLAMAWATAIDALVSRFRDGSPDAADRMLEAARALDRVPFVFHAARLRRNAAQLLEADGRTDEAVQELRHAHEVFQRSGAELELRGTRSQLRSLGVRLPPRSAADGVGALTGRELEIARAVARRLSNREIGARLDVSARTVSTHLSNIFRKLGVDSRGELADLVRNDARLAPPPEG